MKKILGLILATLMSILALGTDYSTKDKYEGKWEDNTTWSNNVMPGTYTTGVCFDVEENANITIKGKVYLNGHLNLQNGSKLSLTQNSILVIDGNFNISDLTSISLEKNASIYIKGDFVTNDKTDKTKYVVVTLNDNSNFVIEGNLESASNANAYLIYKGNADLYVFGSLKGNSYYDSRFSEYAANESEFDWKENQLNKTVDKLTSTLQDPKSWEYYKKDCTLEIPENTKVEIPKGETALISKFTIAKGGTLVNNGTLKIVEDCTDENSSVIDYDFATNCYNYTNPNNGTEPITFINNGTVYCKSWSQKVTMANRPINWTNTGLINCTGDFTIDIGQNHYYNSLCGSQIQAKNMNFYSQKELTLDGIYTCDIMTIDLQNGGNQVNFGANCSTNDVSVMNSLVLKNNISYLNIDGVSTLNGIDARTYSNVTVKIDGAVFVGNTSNNVTITGDSDSEITLCYNATVCSTKTNITSDKNESCGDGYVKSSGTVFFRNPLDDENEVTDHAWYSNSPFDEYTGNKNYISSRDAVNLGSAKAIPNKVSYADCIDRKFTKGTLLPIKLTSFTCDENSQTFEWTTASEENNEYFVVEYSKNGTDWVECTEHIPSMSNTGYTYNAEPIIAIDGSLFSYFRLKQVDLNGEYSYSNIIAVSFTITNPCSDKYLDNRIDIEGNTYRLIHGDLIYCEGDNEK